jgi:hypothetical protein
MLRANMSGVPLLCTLGAALSAAATIDLAGNQLFTAWRTASSNSRPVSATASANLASIAAFPAGSFHLGFREPTRLASDVFSSIFELIDAVVNSVDGFNEIFIHL